MNAVYYYACSAKPACFVIATLSMHVRAVFQLWALPSLDVSTA
jgi:hypothetical protein